MSSLAPDVIKFIRYSWPKSSLINAFNPALVIKLIQPWRKVVYERYEQKVIIVKKQSMSPNLALFYEIVKFEYQV